jgi:RNA polymerase sigma-70 factor (ECF subfamily)
MTDSMPNSTSEVLMGRIANGDERAFAILVHRHQRQVFNFTFRFLGDRAEAEDLTQEVFFRAWKAAGTYKPKAKFTTWLFRIAANLCINRKRSMRIRRWFTGSVADPQSRSLDETAGVDQGVARSSPEDDLIRSERTRQVQTALAALPASQRMALVLKTYDDLSYQEIARIMDRSVPAIDALLVRAKTNLAKKMAQEK